MTFRVRMVLPPTPDTTIYFPFVQRCEAGEIRWIDVPTTDDTAELDEPAPAMQLFGPVATTVPAAPTTRRRSPDDPGDDVGTDDGRPDHGRADHQPDLDRAGDDDAGDVHADDGAGHHRSRPRDDGRGLRGRRLGRDGGARGGPRRPRRRRDRGRAPAPAPAVSVARRWAVATAVATIAVIACAGSASAHAGLETTSPTADSVLASPPTEIVLTFSEAVDTLDDSVRLVSDDGSAVDLGPVTHGGGAASITAPVLGELGDGSYVVAWSVVSADSHPIHGAFVFSVGAPSAGAGDLLDDLDDAGTDGSAGQVWVGVGRFASYTGIAVLVGSLAMSALLAPTTLRTRRVGRLAAVGAVSQSSARS